jgi:hypothetical protein
MVVMEPAGDDPLEPGCPRGCRTEAGPGRQGFHLIAPVRPGDAEFLICAGRPLEPGAVFTDPARPGEWVQVQSQPAPRRVRVLRACAGSQTRFHDRGASWTLVRAAVPWRVLVAHPRASTGIRVRCPQGLPEAAWLGLPSAAHDCQVWIERSVLGGFFKARLECATCGYAGPALARARRPSRRPPLQMLGSD